VVLINLGKIGKESGRMWPQIQNCPLVFAICPRAMRSCSTNRLKRSFLTTKRKAGGRTITTPRLLAKVKYFSGTKNPIGAYGKVYKITHKRTSLVRAMKCLRKTKVPQVTSNAMFNEVNFLKVLDHPNIIGIYDLYSDNKFYYMITELCAGGELFDYIASLEYFYEPTAATYMKQILSAVMYMHDNGVVHRDLKVETLLFSTEKPGSTLRLIDFGESVRLDYDKDGKPKPLTEIIGTVNFIFLINPKPYYIAPEVLKQNYSEKCDVWSCGVLMYICLCGYPPFNGNNDDQILNSVKNGK
jgi:calcium-dependent protein kinase